MPLGQRARGSQRRTAPGWRVARLCAVLSPLFGASALPVPCFAQALTSSMFTPSVGGFAPREDSPLRSVGGLDGTRPAYGITPASGAAGSGYDSLNRKRKVAKPYPGTPHPMPNPPLQAPRVTAPVSPSFAGTAEGAPPRRRLKIDDDPFGQVGNRAGSFLVKSAVEVWGGYDSNPSRLSEPRSSAFYRIAPELQATSLWSRHAVDLDLRGSFTGYGTEFPTTSGASSVPVDIDRPDFNGRLSGRLDVTRDTRVVSAVRLRLGTDNPGARDNIIQYGLSKYPIYATYGGTAGFEQDFNRLQLQVNGNIDRTVYQNSKLIDGTSWSNDDRNFNQYGVQARASYDLTPGVKPFVEVVADKRVHDTRLDRYDYERDSTGGYLKGGTSFEFSRLLTGEIAAGYGWRDYQDPRLKRMDGLLTSASLIWRATGLTTVRLDAVSSINETTLPGVSGSLSRDYTAQVDHAFRRWLIGTARFGYGTSDYQTAGQDKRYFAEGTLTYKLSRTFAIKGSLRHDWLESGSGGVNTAATVVMLGVRVQR